MPVLLLIWSLTFAVAADWVAGDGGVISYLQLKQEVAKLETQQRALRAGNAFLMADIKEIQESPWRVEEIARRDLGMVRPDEVVHVFSE
ncbi:MAG: hypothetical protein COX57_00550 [Alphaproteobacteria bacterium CG_4_10_14_0_2_um_filter_63_37]|nr:MAG: hypothetical protein AUJ55_05330 [Proteobacteria bacterium CG1_02_64_396]PJA25969.1 MAG: hypothetical protein COX57_00550 [Alphaproteobacteria bacterium CG_4_10_14_0_2_um_filter_63_37]